MSLRARIAALETSTLAPDEVQFHQFAAPGSTYDNSLSLLENLRSLELPPGAIPYPLSHFDADAHESEGATQ